MKYLITYAKQKGGVGAPRFHQVIAERHTQWVERNIGEGLYLINHEGISEETAKKLIERGIPEWIAS